MKETIEIIEAGQVPLTERRGMVRDIMFRTEMSRKRQMHPKWGEMGLIAGQPRVLSELFCREKITQRELADLSCVEPATLSRALDRLEDMGYIVRNDNPDCRRSFLISLTEEGTRMAELVLEEFCRLEASMFKGFSVGELEILNDYMTRIYDNLQ